MIFKKMTRPTPTYAHKPKTPTHGCHGNFWSKNTFLILACDETIYKIETIFVQSFFWFDPPSPPLRKRQRLLLSGVTETSGQKAYS